MDTGAPMPGIVSDGDDLYVAYIVNSSAVSEYEEFAVVRFSHALQHTFGYPNDEALGGHPLFDDGLAFYAFNLVTESPSLRELGERNARVFPKTEAMYSDFSHWIVTFHDETLEVIAKSANVVGRVEAKNARSAIFNYVDAP